MAQQTTAPRESVPPEERFWVRYSPHHELPLSGVGSFTAHLLVIGLLLLCAYPLAHLFSRPVHQVPVEVVHLEPDGIPGGGGDGPAARPPAGKVEVGNEDRPNRHRDPDLPKRPELTVRGPKVEKVFDPKAVRQVQQGDLLPDPAAFKKLAEKVRSMEGEPGAGGKVPGGNGEGPGPGKGKLNRRVERMLRWTLMFNTDNGADYLAQLRGLGAILAIPVNVENREFKFVRKLTPPAQLEEEDITKINRIYWVDEKPESVRDLMAALGVKMRPSFFVAFMPEELENKLFELEKAKAGGRPEDQILETKFKVKRTGDRSEPVFDSISFKK
jgi:hypothetical protein